MKWDWRGKERDNPGRAFHDTLGEVVEHCGLECEHLPPDDRVGQRQAHKEGLEGSEASVGSQAKTHWGSTERPCSPLGEGGRDSLFNIHFSCMSGRGEKGTIKSMYINIRTHNMVNSINKPTPWTKTFL